MTGPRLIASDSRSPPPRTGYRVRGSIRPVFVEQGAVSAERSIAFVPPKGAERAFATLIANGTIKIGSAGGYWFDGLAHERLEAARTRRLVPLLIAGAILLAALLTLFYRG